jgi:DNA modification methylase
MEDITFLSENGSEMINGSSLEKLKNIKPFTYDAVITDPPFKISKKDVEITKKKNRFLTTKAKIKQDFGNWDHFETEQEYYKFTHEWIRLVSRTLKRTSNFISFTSIERVTMFKMILTDLGFTFKDVLIWQKPNPAPNVMKLGLVSSYEALVWATVCKKQEYFFNKKYKQHPNVISHNVFKGKTRFHVCEKPIGLIETLLDIFTDQGHKVLDCFAGSGVVGDACRKTGRKFTLIEEDPNYYSQILNRLKQQTLWG